MKFNIYLTLIFSLFIGSFSFKISKASSFLYVETFGNDKNFCSFDSPCKTISHAIAVSNVGDIIKVGSGVYKENVNINKSISLIGNNAIIDGSNLPVQSGGGLINIPSGVVASVSGFEVINGSTYGISVFSNNSIISNNKIHDIKGAGLWVRDAKYNTFDSNEIYKTVQNNYFNSGCSLTNTNWESAINSWGSSSYNTYIRNYIHDNCGEGVVVHNYDVITENTFLNNWSVEIYLESVQFATVSNNLIKNTKTYVPRGSDQSWKAVPYGISIGDETTPCITSDNIIINNNIIGLRHGISFYPYSSCGNNSGIKNTRIENNKIFDSKEYGIRILSGNHFNSVIFNNIISTYGTIAKPLTIQSSSFAISGNSFFSDLNVFEYNGKTYNFTSWSTIVQGNFWDLNIQYTQTPIFTTTPTIHLTSSSTSTPLSTKTLTPTPTNKPPTSTTTSFPKWVCIQLSEDTMSCQKTP